LDHLADGLIDSNHNAPQQNKKLASFEHFSLVDAVTGNGRIDVVTTALGSPAEIWMNQSGNHNHWLDVALEGTKSNRDGIGASIRVETASGNQYNSMSSASGYASSSLGSVHFGLGKESVVKVLQVDWPSGIKQTFRGLQADRVLRLKKCSRVFGARSLARCAYRANVV